MREPAVAPDGADGGGARRRSRSPRRCGGASGGRSRCSTRPGRHLGRQRRLGVSCTWTVSCPPSAERVDATVTAGRPGAVRRGAHRVKDLEDCAGMPTTHGSPALHGRARWPRLDPRRPVAGRRGGPRRQDRHAGVRHAQLHPYEGRRRRPQPLGPGADAGRLERRKRGGGGRGPGPGGDGQRRRGLDPHPGVVLRAGRLQAQPRADPPPRPAGLGDGRARPADHDGGRQRPPPRRHRRADNDRFAAGPGRPLRGGHRVAAGGRPASPLVARPGLRDPEVRSVAEAAVRLAGRRAWRSTTSRCPSPTRCGLARCGRSTCGWRWSRGCGRAWPAPHPYARSVLEQTESYPAPAWPRRPGEQVTLDAAQLFAGSTCS